MNAKRERAVFSREENGEVQTDWVSASELLAQNVTELPTLLYPLIPQGVICLMTGASDTGKSTFLRQLCCAIVKGQDKFLDLKLNVKYQRAYYISTEDEDHGMAFQLQRQFGKNDHADYEGLKFLFKTDNYLAKIESVLKNEPADLIVVDAFADLMNGEMNSTINVRRQLQPLHNLCQRFGCTCIVLHHVSKAGAERAPSKHNVLGSTGMENKARSVLYLSKDPERAGIVYLSVVKHNTIPEEDKRNSYELRLNDTQLFEPTGEKVLTSSLGTDNQLKEQAKELAIELRRSGLTIDEIFESLRERKFFFARSTIGNWVRGIGELAEIAIEYQQESRVIGELEEE